MRMPDATSVLPNGLMAEVEETARAQNRQPAEVLEDAVRRYLDDQKWERLVTSGARRAKEKGLTEADVPRLIEEVRNENRARGR
jgi:predicted transcriptional regulator